MHITEFPKTNNWDFTWHKIKLSKFQCAILRTYELKI